MNLHSFAPDAKKPDTHLETLEARELTPEQAAKETLRQADRLLTDQKSQLEALKMSLDARSADRARIQELEDDLDAEWAELVTEVRAATQSEVAPVQAPTEDELDWDIPEEIKILETNPDRISQLLSEPNADIAHLGASIDSLPLEKKTLLLTSLSEKIGSKFSQRFIDSAEYRSQLSQLAQSLSEKLPNGAMLLKERSVKNLIVLFETVGPEAPAIARAMDLSTYLPGLERHETDSVFSIPISSFDEEGNLERSRVVFEQHYTHKSEPDAEVTRAFEVFTEKNEQGKSVTKKRVLHEVFKIPPDARAGSIAAKMTADCLPYYDRANVSEIDLRANITLGGYVWASYGYNWDQEKMGRDQYVLSERQKALDEFDTQAFVADLEKKKPGIPAGEVSYKLKTHLESIRIRTEIKANKDFDAMVPANRIELFSQSVQTLARNMLEKYKKAAKMAGMESNPETQAVLKELETATKDGLGITPQHLAAIGKNGPQFIRGISNIWYTEEGFKQAVAEGVDKPDPSLGGPAHAGKIGLAGSIWSGKIELTEDGPQGGKNRKLLEAALQRRLKK